MKRKRTKSRYRQAGEKLVFALGAIPKEGVPELKIRYTRTRKAFLGKVTEPANAANFIRRLYTRGTLQLQEQFIVLYLNQANEIIGYYKHTVGGINAAMTDMRLILGTALKCACVSMIVAHNHPSGNIQPSDADKKITSRLKEAAALMDIRLLDHVIVTKTDFTSFADSGLM